MAKRQEDLDRGVAAMLALSGPPGGAAFIVTRGVTRPVWEPSEATLAMVDTARQIAAGMGLTLTHQSAGGGSDGNFQRRVGHSDTGWPGGCRVAACTPWASISWWTAWRRSARLIAGLMDAYR